MTQATRANFEELLDAGRLETAVGPGRWWKLRRNGRTRTWKRDPGRFLVPVKAGFREAGWITNTNFSAEGVLDSTFFRIGDEN